MAVAMVALLVAGAALPASSARSRQPRRVAQGSWGAPHIRVEVGDGSATIEYDCAHGQINGPLVIDRRGRFDLKGTHSPEHAGPIRNNEESAGEPARYTGWTDGKQMMLTVTLVNSKESVGTFNLTLGGGGRIFKCK